MIAPLYDSRGTIRYFIGAQVDVSGLVKDCTGLDAFEQLIYRADNPKQAAREDRENQKDEFQDLTEMFNVAELATVRKHGGRMHQDQVETDDTASISSSRPRLLLTDPTSDLLDHKTRAIPQSVATPEAARTNGRLQGVYQNVGSPRNTRLRCH